MPAPTPIVRIKQGSERKLRHQHPWAHKDEILTVTGSPENGGIVQVNDFQGAPLGLGTYNRLSRFPIKMLTTDLSESIDRAFFKRKFAAAKNLRIGIEATSNAQRILYSEADGVPGLIADKYEDTICVQVRTLGMELLKPIWFPALLEAYAPTSVVERSDMEGRRDEGLEPLIRDLMGEAPNFVDIHENGLIFRVPVRTGSKTGFYLDQRDNRKKLAEKVRPGQQVLDCFCYSGGFSLNAAKAGGIVTGIDLNPEAIELANQNAELNGLSATFLEGNAFEKIEELAKSGQKFDWIILDPPAIAKTKESRDALKWAIWNLMTHVCDLLNPGGQVVAFSCAFQVDSKMLIDSMTLAAGDKGCRIIINDLTLQPPDHPYFGHFPEGLYLKGVWATVVS